MVFKSLDSLQPVVNILNEANEALKDKSRTICNSAIPDILLSVLGAGMGGSISFVSLYRLGTVGLSAPGISSGLAAAGRLVRGGMAAGVLVLAVPIAVCAVGGVCLAHHLKNKKLNNEKKRLYTEALKKHEAIINALKKENEANKERIEYLISLNKTLRMVIKDLKNDLEMA